MFYFNLVPGAWPRPGGPGPTLPWLAARARRRDVGGNPFAPFEEIWHPAVHRAHAEIRVQAEQGEPRSAPGDQPHPRI
jgi:hypothetical protein